MIYQGKQIIAQYLGTQSIVRKYLADALFWEYAAKPKCDIVVTYNVTSTTAATTLIGHSVFALTTQKKLDTVMYVDGKEQPLAKEYTFPTTGLHTVGFNTIVDTLDGALFSNVNILMATANTNITKVEVGFGKTLTTLTATANGSGTSTKAIGAFGHCTSLKEVIVGPSITTITGPVFGMCTALEKATIGENVTDMSNYNGSSVNYGVFQKDTALMEIRFEGTTAPFVGANAIPTSNEGTVYHPCGSDYSQVMSTCQEEIDGMYYAWKEECFEVEPEVVEPEYRADIIATYNVTSTSTPIRIIFSYDASMIEGMWIDGIYYNPSDVNLREYTFLTTGLHSITYKLFDNKYLMNNAFYNLPNITRIELADSFTTIASRAFSGCSDLAELTCYATVAPATQQYAFDKKPDLVLIYPCGSDYSNWIDTIGCADTCAPTEVTDYDILAEFVPSRETIAILSSKSNVSKIWINDIEVDVSTNYTFETIGETYTVKYKLIDNTQINIGLFYQCYDLISIELPDSITSIGSSSFTFCSGLTSITIPEGVTTIGGGAFLGCSSLTSIDIPSSVTTISDKVFKDCNNLATITCNATTAPNIVSDTFDGVPASVVLTYPCGSDYSTWISALGCVDTCAPTEVTDYDIKAVYDVVKTTSATFIAGSGMASNLAKMYIDDEEVDTSTTSFKFSTLGEHTVKFKLIDNTALPNNAFNNCDDLASIELPDTLVTIGKFCFYSTMDEMKLQSITIPANVTSVGSYAFKGLPNLSEITCNAVTAPTIVNGSFYWLAPTGVLHYPCGSDYSSWMTQLSGWTSECFGDEPEVYDIDVEYSKLDNNGQAVFNLNGTTYSFTDTHVQVNLADLGVDEVTSLNFSMSYLNKVNHLPDLSNIENANIMFNGTQITSLPSDIVWPSRAISCNSMFAYCPITKIPVTPQVSSANGMFMSTNLETARIDESFANCSDFNAAFAGCQNLKQVDFTVEVSPAKTSSMFYGCSALTEFKTLRNLKLNEVTNASSMFENSSVTPQMLKDLGIVARFGNKLTNASSMFKGCASFNPAECTEAAHPNLFNLFNGCSYLDNVSHIFEQCGLSGGYNAAIHMNPFQSSVTDVSYAMAQTQVQVAQFLYLENLRTTQCMFLACSQLDHVYFESLYGTFENTQGMFAGCGNMRDFDGVGMSNTDCVAYQAIESALADADISTNIDADVQCDGDGNGDGDIDINDIPSSGWFYLGDNLYVNLNNQWEVSEGEFGWEGVTFKSFSNVGVDNSAAVMYFKYVPSDDGTYTSPKYFKIANDSENGYDYVMVSQPDVDITKVSDPREYSLITAQDKPIGNWTSAEFDWDAYNGAQECVFTVMYIKDSSSADHADRGYINFTINN